MSLASIAINGVTVSYGPRLVLSDITFGLGPHTRMGVIGRNGSGKSTLLKTVAGIITPDRGTIVSMPPQASLAYLTQEPDRGSEAVADYLLRRSGVREANEGLERTAAALVDGTKASADAYEAALERYTSSGAADYDARIASVLSDVGLSERALGVEMQNLSGGEAAKASLASILLGSFDLLLLDEPTNDLDFRGLELLEAFMVQSETGVLLVSHDRAFIERTTTSILEIDEHLHTATQYGGGWSAFERERRARTEHARQQYDEYETKRSELQQRAQRQRQWSEQGVVSRNKKRVDNDKFARDFFNDRTEKQAQKARSTEKAMERLERVDKPWEGWQLQMTLPIAPRAGDVVARLDEAIVHRGDFVLGPVSLEIGWAERIAVVGTNGSGKSTLIRALLGTERLVSGNRHLGPGVIVGELDQLRTIFDTNDTLAATFMRASGLLAADTRSLLAKFDLGADHALRQSATLSPGERTRALLALLMARQTNLLVLDEPTNHLDMEAIEQLESALDTYNGTLVLVTHDRRLLEVVDISRTIEVHDGTVLNQKQ